MTGDDTPRERLARVETEISHIKDNLDAANKKLDTLHDLMMQGQGGMKVFRWATVAIAGITGYTATYLPKLTTLFSGLPK